MSVITITKDNFESEVLKSPVPVLLDFWATWCGPCRMVSPIVDEIAEESDGSYKVGKINVDEQPELASQFRVMSIPTLVVMKDGAVYKSSIGMQPKASILALLLEPLLQILAVPDAVNRTACVFCIQRFHIYGKPVLLQYLSIRILLVYWLSSCRVYGISFSVRKIILMDFDSAKHRAGQQIFPYAFQNRLFLRQLTTSVSCFLLLAILLIDSPVT